MKNINNIINIDYVKTKYHSYFVFNIEISHLKFTITIIIDLFLVYP